MIDDRSDKAALERFRIRERIDLYIDALNHREWKTMEDLWTVDGIWSTSAPAEYRVEGRPAMMEFLRSYQQYQFGFVFQMGHGVVVDLISDVFAKSRHTLHIIGDSMNIIGIYYDSLVKEFDGKWRFKRRDYRITYFDNSVQPGASYRLLPDPDYRDLPGP